MKRQLSNTIYGLKFAMEKNDFERLKSSSGKKRNDFVANPIVLMFELIEIRSESVVETTRRGMLSFIK